MEKKKKKFSQNFSKKQKKRRANKKEKTINKKIIKKKKKIRETVVFLCDCLNVCIPMLLVPIVSVAGQLVIWFVKCLRDEKRE